MTTPTAYPLQWPKGWPKTAPDERESGKQFRTTLAGALSNLQEEVKRLGGEGLVLSSNYTLGVSRPTDPGVVAYFNYQKLPVAIPCDRWALIEANVRAIALTIEAMRGMERWGAKHMIRAMFSGFKALPAPAGSSRHWTEVLRLSADCSRDEFNKRYRELAAERHPDRTGGDSSLMTALNVARDEAKAERGW